MEGLPNPGDVLLVGRAASVQFGRPITFRVIRVITEWITYDRWVWLHGYQLDERGTAVAKRDILVQPAGLHLVRRAATAPRRQPNQRPARPKTATTPQTPAATQQSSRPAPAPPPRPTETSPTPAARSAPPPPRTPTAPATRPTDQGR